MKKIKIQLFFLIITAVFLHQGFSLDRIVQEADMLGVYLPNKDYTFKILKDGYLPLWSDELALGYPIIAEGHVAFFYPLNMLCLFLPTILAVNIYFIFHYFLACYFTYLFCKTIKLNDFSSILAGLSFAFGGYLTGHSVHLNIVTTCSWLPLVLLFVEKGFKNTRYFILAGVTMGIQTLAYFPQISLYTGMGIFLYFLARGYVLKEYKIWGLFITIAVAFLLSSIQTIITYELVKNSVRAEGIGSDFLRGTFHLSYLKYIFLPNYHKYIDKINCPKEYYIYIGIIPIFLSSLTFLIKNKYKYILYTLFIVPFIYSMHNIYKLFYSTPFLNFFAAPSRFLFLSSFSLSICAAMGFSFVRKKILKILILLLVIFDLYIFNVKKNIVFVDKENPSQEIVSFLKKDKTHYRICTIAGTVHAIAPNLNLYYNIPSFNLFTPLMLERWWIFFNIYIKEGDKRILDLSNIEYLLHKEEIFHPQLSLVFQNQDTKIYKNHTNINTYAFIVNKHIKVKNKYEALKLFKDKNFNFRDTVIIEESANLVREKLFSYNIFKTFGRKGFKTFMKDDGFLVFSQSFYPGWSAYIDKRRTKIYPADYAIQAIYLSKGEHFIDFVYEPSSFKFGWILSCASGIIIIVIFLGILKGEMKNGR